MMSPVPELWKRICDETSPDQLSFRALLAVLDRSERRDDPQFILELQRLVREWPSFARSISEHLALHELNPADLLPHLPGLDLFSELQIDHYNGGSPDFIRWLSEQSLQSLKKLAFQSNENQVPVELQTSPWFRQLNSLSLNATQWRDLATGDVSNFSNVDVWLNDKTLLDRIYHPNSPPCPLRLSLALSSETLTAKPNVLEEYGRFVSTVCVYDTKDIGAVIMRLPESLSSLSLDRCEVSPQSLAMILDGKRFPQLDELVLEGCKWVSSHCAVTGVVSHLKRMVWSLEENIADVIPASALPEVSELNLELSNSNTRTEEWIRHSTLPATLESLTYENSELSPLNTLFATQYARLTSVSLCNIANVSETLRKLGMCTARPIRCLAVGRSAFDESSLDLLSDDPTFSQLRSIDLNWSELSIESAIRFCRSPVASGLRSLMKMMFSDPCRTNEFLSGIASKHSFEQLVEWNWPCYPTWDERVAEAVVASSFVSHLDFLHMGGRYTDKVSRLLLASDDVRKVLKAYASAPSREQIRVGMRGGFADTDPAQGGV